MNSAIKELSDIRADAIHYSPEEAQTLYVDHPGGLPTLDRNTLIVGPMGSGKTIMLKALFAQWRKNDKINPIFFDTVRWCSQLFGETIVYQDLKLSPYGNTLYEAISFSLALAICECSGVFSAPQNFPNTMGMLREALNLSDTEAIRSLARQKIKNCVMKGEKLPYDLPTTFDFVGSIGREIERQGKLMVLLVDSVDQVNCLYFVPIASLLRRSSSNITILATRPCPAAPQAEVIQGDIVAGDSYRLLQLGKTEEGHVPESFVRKFIEHLPLKNPFDNEIRDSAQLIMNITWPSIRFAISIINEYINLRSRANKNPLESLYGAIMESARNFEDIAFDHLRAWSAYPQKIIYDLKEMFCNIDNNNGRFGRSIISLPQNDLFRTDVSSNAQRLMRIILNKGIFMVGPKEHYIPGNIPLTYEIAPLCLANYQKVDISRFETQPIIKEIDHKKLSSWCSTFIRRKSDTSKKSVFISYWMTGPEQELNLVTYIKNKFRDNVNILTGEEILGSPHWSTKIVELMRQSDIALLDLTTNRRDIYVEYGIAIGQRKPVVQCISESALLESLPIWVKNRQVQIFHGNARDYEKLDASISSLLESSTLRDRWERDALGGDLISYPCINSLTIVTHGKADIADLLTGANEMGFTHREICLDPKLDQLDEIISAVRGAGLLLLIFNGSQTDYISCVAGGIFVQRTKGQLDQKKYFARRLIIWADDAHVPGMLKSFPKVIIGKGTSASNAFRSTLGELLRIRKEKQG